jgi:hypothetical protein
MGVYLSDNLFFVQVLVHSMLKNEYTFANSDIWSIFNIKEYLLLWVHRHFHDETCLLAVETYSSRFSGIEAVCNLQVNVSHLLSQRSEHVSTWFGLVGVLGGILVGFLLAPCFPAQA